MPKQKLESLLKSLHEELSEVTELDENTEQLLETLAQDISQILEPEQNLPQENLPPKEVLDNLANKFAEEHPGAAAVIREITRTLANIGV